MSRPTSDHLHRLIKSLSKAEKRYFKIFAGRHSSNGKSDYITLFDAIDKQDEYDESKLIRKFRGSTFGQSPAIAKNRLYEAVLKSLHAFHSESSVGVELQRLLHYAEILFNKSLYDESRKVLNKARRLAEKFERHSFLLDIRSWEKRLMEKDSYVGLQAEDLEIILDEDNAIIGKLKNYAEFWNIKSRLMLLLNKRGKVRDSEEMQNFKKIIDNVLMNNDDKDLSIDSKYLYYQIYSAYYFGTGDYQRSYDHILKQLELIEGDLELYREEPNKYFSALSNLIYLCTQLQKFDEVPGLLEKLKSIPEGKFRMNDDLDIKLFSTTYSTELSLYIQTGEFRKALRIVEIIDAGLKNYEGKISKVRESFFRFSIAQVYFGLEDYPMALKWINQLLNDSDIDESQDIHCMARIFNMIIHLEAGNDDLVPYTLRSTQRYLEKRNRIYKFESIILSFINKLIKGNVYTERHGLYKDLRAELSQISNDPFEKSVFEYFDFISWADSKYLEKPFLELVRIRSVQKDLKAIES
jgi:tetratricopeptide (TPR) repeat protein